MIFGRRFLYRGQGTPGKGIPGKTFPRPRYALHFDGNTTSNAGIIPDSADLSPSGEMTISTWILQEAQAPSANACSIASKHTNGVQAVWILNIHPVSQLKGIIAAAGNDVGVNYAATPTGSWTVGSWHHVAMVYSGAGATNDDKLKLYIDGAIQSSSFRGTIATSLVNGTEPMALGMPRTGSICRFSGVIDTFRFFNTALSAHEIGMLNGYAEVNRGLVAKWDFDEGTGSIFFDSKNLNSGSLSGGVTWIRR